MDRGAVVALLEGFAAGFRPPVVEGARVRAVAADPFGYRVESDRGAWRARAVVIATGACGRPRIPDFAAALPADIVQVAPDAYRRPADLPAGGVLVVGGSATGVQLAAELQASGRPVTLAVGRHSRMLRRYRGRDIFAWLEAARHYSPELEPRRRHRGRPAPALVAAFRAAARSTLPRSPPRASASSGAPRERTAGARARRRAGARLRRLGRRLRRTLARIDAHIAAAGIAAPPDPAAWRTPTHPASDLRSLDLAAAGIASVVWATGYRRDYGWLEVPVLDAAGEIVHQGGVTAAPGLYVLGLRFLRHRSSNFIDGVGRDAEALAAEIAASCASASPPEKVRPCPSPRATTP